jgi:hypothetical protein
MIALAVSIQLATVLAFVVARKTWRRVPVRLEDGRLRAPCFDGVIDATQARHWTLDQAVAHVYCTAASWKLTCRRDDENVLREMLTQVLGDSVPLKARGSQRARRVALAAATIGLTGIVAGIAFELIPVFVVGLVALAVGSACYGVLGTKMAAGARRS